MNTPASSNRYKVERSIVAGEWAPAPDIFDEWRTIEDAEWKLDNYSLHLDPTSGWRIVDIDGKVIEEYQRRQIRRAEDPFTRKACAVIIGAFFVALYLWGSR